jgi:hypothetical protein
MEVVDDRNIAAVDIGPWDIDTSLVDDLDIPSDRSDSFDEGPVFAPSNIPAGTTLAPCGELALTASAGVNTTTCETTSLSPTCKGTVVSQAKGGSKVCVIRARRLDIPKGDTLTVAGDKPLVLVLEGDSSVDGTLSGAASGAKPGPGGGAGAPFVSTAKGYEPQTGGGPGGGGTCTCDQHDKDDCAGGAGGYGSKGADGGVEDEGNGGCTPPPVGGSTYGNKSLVPLQGGSGGASGRNTEGSAGKPGIGGGGGGAIQLSVQGTLTVSGVINMGGGGGGHSNDDQQQWPGGAGGGGSGGTVLLEAVEILGVGTVACNGGGGGGGGTHNEKGKDGQDGQPGVTPAKGAPGVQDGKSGGDGAAGTTAPTVGGSGMDAPGGGGGGLGRIRLNWCQTCAGVSAPTLVTSGISSTGAVALSP